MQLRVAGGWVVSPSGCTRADVICDGGRVVGIVSPAIVMECEATVDAAGCFVFPGFVDPHVHSRDPGSLAKEDFAHSTRGSAAGGVTTLLDMPNTVPPVTSATVLNERIAAHEVVAHVDFGLWGMSLGAINMSEIPALIAAGAVAIKLFWGYAFMRESKQLVPSFVGRESEDLIPPLSDRDVFDLFRTVSDAHGLVGAHCDNPAILAAAANSLGRKVEDYEDLVRIRPAEAEASHVAVGIEFARATNCDLHILHVSCERTVELIRRARLEGIPITGETCPHYLTLTASDCGKGGPKMFPPIRGAADRDSLWTGLRDGTITSVGSDHAPHTIEEKSLPLADQPPGITANETFGPVMINEMLRGRLTPERLSWIMAEGTARRFGLFPRKGAILPGSDADFAVIDPKGSSDVDQTKLQSKSKLSPWNGWRLEGKVRAVVLRGRVVAENGAPVGSPIGRFIPRSPVRSELDPRTGLPDYLRGTEV